MTENEYKYLLNKEEFAKIQNKVISLNYDVTSRLQINYYYDDEVLSLNKKNITLRVRQKENSLVLQKKEHKSRVDNLSISSENSVLLDTLPIIIDNKYCLKGNLVTYRNHYIVQDNLYIDFDTNYYLGICDYEIEIEFDKANEEKARKIVNMLGIPSEEIIRGKSTRFLEKLEERLHGQI